MLQDYIWNAMHTAPGAYSKEAPGAVCIHMMLLEHIWFETLLLIIFFSSVPYGTGAHGPDQKTKHMVLNSKPRPKSQKSGV